MEAQIKDYVSKHFTKDVSYVRQLDGYEDKNYLIEVKQVSDGIDFGQGNGPAEKFVFKISTSSTEKHLDLQFMLMTLLHSSGIQTCLPLQDIQGKYRHPWADSSGDLNEESVSVQAYMLTYIPGVTLLEAGNPLYLMEEVGKLTGRINKILQTLPIDSTRHIDTDTLWTMTRALDLEPLLSEVCSKDEAQLGEQILLSYKMEVMPCLDKFQKGFIHGDINNCNIIVRRSQDDINSYVISGIIDYADACTSFYVYELATIMADLMSSGKDTNDPLIAAKLIFKGYFSEMKLNDVEIRLLKIVLCVRMIQYYVLSGETLRHNPENKYVALDRKEYIEVCSYIWNMDDMYFHKQVTHAT